MRSFIIRTAIVSVFAVVVIYVTGIDNHHFKKSPVCVESSS